MAITYTMEEKGDTLIVETQGFDESLEEVIAYNNAVKEKAEALNCKNILCDERGLEYRLRPIPENNDPKIERISGIG